jgi:soluble cytochrome b562
MARQIETRRTQCRTLAPGRALPARATAGSSHKYCHYLIPCVLAVFLACFASSQAYGDVGVLLNESLDTSVARITGSGHSAVYFSNICPESPVKLRLCRPGELGSVVSNYTTLGEDQPYEWNAVPFSVYLYGVEDPQNRPVFGSRKIKRALEERYREKYLTGFCASHSCQTSNDAEWREMVGATLSRSIYIFIVDTSVEQDLEIIREFNSQPNVNHFNGVTRNCANFTLRVVNTYFPHSASADYINDFGIASPKAIARTFTHYAEKHPEAHFRVLHIAQVPGTIKRSSEARAGTEQLYRSKKLLVPMLIFADHELPFVAASYLLTGRFNPEHELEEHPTAEVTDISYQIKQAKSEKDTARAEELGAAAGEARKHVVGTSKEWQQYREDFDSVVEEAVSQQIIAERGDLDRTFKHLDKAGTPHLDSNGAIWMEISNQDEISTIGLSASNIFGAGTDPRLEYEFILARTDHELKSPKHSRETMLEFRNDWTLLQNARVKRVLPMAQAIASAPSAKGPAISTAALD